MKKYKWQKLLSVMVAIVLFATFTTELTFNLSQLSQLSTQKVQAVETDTAQRSIETQSYGNYSSNWKYWLQGASKYSELRSYGCRIVANSKMLAESGIASSSFNPDVYFEWGARNGEWTLYNAYELHSSGVAVGKYAKQQGSSVEYVGYTSLQYGATYNSSIAKSNAQLIQKAINDGYYVILSCSSHQAYVSRQDSLAKGTPVVSDSWSSYSYNPSSLVNYTSYKHFNFTSFWKFKVKNSNDSVTESTTTRPAKPTNIKAVAKSSELINISWSKSSTADGYEVYRFVDGKSVFYKDLKGQSTTQFDNSGKLPNTTYYYKLRSYKTVNGEKIYSGFTDLITCKTPQSSLVVTKPLKPTNIKARAKSPELINVTWDKVSGVAGYEVYRFVDGKSVFYKDIKGENTTEFNNSGKLPDTTYYYKLRSYKVVNGEKLYSGFTNLFTCTTPKK